MVLALRDGRQSSLGAATVEPTTHPLRDDRLELGRSLLPDAVTGLENIQSCMRESFAQNRRVSGETVRVVPANHDCNGHLDRRKMRCEYRQVFRIGANERR